jgi:hypothetical protein
MLGRRFMRTSMTIVNAATHAEDWCSQRHVSGAGRRHGCVFVIAVLLLLASHFEAAPAASVRGEGSQARDAGAGCPVGWGGGVGRAGEREAPTCQSVRRSFPSIQTGQVVVAPSRVSPLASFRHSFPKPFRASPHVLASVNGFVQDVSAAGANTWDTVNGSFVVTVRSTGRAGFSANVYRTDGAPASMTDGWHGPLIVAYVAWDYFQEEGNGNGRQRGSKGRAAGERGREGEVGVLFGSWDVPPNKSPPPGAPWVPAAGDLPDAHHFMPVTPHNPPGTAGKANKDKAGAGVDGIDLESEMAAYGGGQPEVVRVPFGTVFDEPPRVLVASRITCPYDRQAVLALTVRTVSTNGFELNVARVDQSWALQAYAVDYIAWLPSHDMVTGPDMLDQSKRAYRGSGSMTGSERLASSLPAPELGTCAPYCSLRLWSRDLDPYVLPRAQFGGHLLSAPVPTSAGFGPFSFPDSRWGAEVWTAAGHGLGQRGSRLPSSVQYQLRFEFKDVFGNHTTPFNFTRPPFMLVSARTLRNLIPEHAEPVDDTVSVSLAKVTATDFVVNVFRVDRNGAQWPDRGGRGWLKALELDWLAWEPAVEDITVLKAGTPTAAAVSLDRYSYFRVDVFDHTHDVIIHLKTMASSPSEIDLADSPLAAQAAADAAGASGGAGVRADTGRAWLPHYVFPVAGPPTAESGRIIRLADTAPPSARTRRAFLRLLNEGLVPLDSCHGGRDWTGDDPKAAWVRSSSCALELGRDVREDPGSGANTLVDHRDRGDGGRAWPFAEAFAYVEAEQQWVLIECAGIGCRHRLPLKIAPLLMVASTQVSYPTREFIGTRLPYGGGGTGGGTDGNSARGGWGGMGHGNGRSWGEQEAVVGVREVTDTWVSDFLDSSGGMRLHVYSTDNRWRAGRLYVGVLGLAAAEFEITAHVGRIAPLGTEIVSKTSMTSFVPYKGRMKVGRTYGGSVEAGKWVYFRLTLSASDINANAAATVITVAHAQPMQEVGIYLRKNEAPVDAQTLPPPLASTVLVSEGTGGAGSATSYTLAFLVEDPVSRTLAGWSVANGQSLRSVGSSVCGSFGRIIGGQGLLGHASWLQRSFGVPRVHTEVRIKLDFIKIDLWDGHTARLLVDGEEVWRRTFACDVIRDGMCSGSSRGAQECGKGDDQWTEEKVEIDVTVPHVTAALTLRVETDLPHDEPFADHRSWGLGALEISYQHSSRRSAQWVDSSTLLYASNMSIPPTEVQDECTPSNPFPADGCRWNEPHTVRSCQDTDLCSTRAMMYRLSTAGEYFVGVYGLSVTNSLPFTIRTAVRHTAFDAGEEGLWDTASDEAGRNPWVTVGRRAEALALVETYPRVTVAHGPGVSVGLTGVPATFYIRAKDKYGNLRTTGGDGYHLSFQGPCGIEQDSSAQYPACVNASASYLDKAKCPSACNEPAAVPHVRTYVFDLGDGSYLASYVLTAGGQYAMSVKLHGLHIRGSPFVVTASPDAALLPAATGATFAGSHVRLANPTGITHQRIEQFQYAYFLVDVVDMTSDVVVQVDTLAGGETDVLISNTRTHPSHNAPADVQWKSEWVTGGASASGGIGGGGGKHRLHISYADPLYLAGPYYIAVYARLESTINISATVEQVARQIEIGRSYGSTIASNLNCSSDADCADLFTCISQLCSQRRRFRFRPHAPAHAYFFRVQAIAPATGFETSNCAPAGSFCPCAPLRVYVTRGRPYPDGETVGSATASDTPSQEEADRKGEYTPCIHHYTVTALTPQPSVAYYMTVEAAPHAGNSTSRFTVRVLSSSVSSETANDLFKPVVSAANTRAARSTMPGDDFDHSKGNISKLALGVASRGTLPQWERAFFAVEHVDPQAELICRTKCTSGKVLMFMSTDTNYPTRSRAAQVLLADPCLQRYRRGRRDDSKQISARRCRGDCSEA